MATATGVPGPMEVGAAGSKGLKTGALGFVSNVVIGVASTAPAYSLAVSLGLVALAVGVASPAIMWMAFVPMLFIAIAYYYMNRADPDCGTSFTWVSRAMGPHLGWITGWAIIVADVIVMASLAEIAAQYTFALFGIDVYETPIWAVTIGEQSVDFGVIALGVLFVAVLTWICYRGIELSARTQVVLLGIELLALAAFAGVAPFRVYTDPPPGAILPTLEWLNPLAIVGEDGAFSASALAAGLLVALFIYWGWDTTATVNEESADPTEQPGRATIVSTLILVATYLLVTIAAQAWAGVERLQDAGESDVFAAMANEILGSPLDKIVILAVLTSAAASTQTTILPTARTALSMGAKGALPSFWAKVHPRFQTPTNATIWMGILSVVFYIGLKLISENLYWDALASLGLMIAFYYGLTGYACAIYYRHELFKSTKNLLLIGVLPLLGGLMLTWAFVQSVIDLADPLNSYTCTDPEDVSTCAQLFGVGVPLAVAIISLVLGLVLMVLWWLRSPAFFHRRAEAFGEGPVAPTPTTTIHPAPGH
jgi:amino acid transporter